MVSSILVEPRQNNGIRYRFKTRQETSSEQTRRFVVKGTPDDGGLNCPGIGRSEFQGVGSEVITFAQPNSYWLRGSPLLFRLANCIPAFFQSCEWFALRPGIGVVSGWGNPELSARRTPGY